MPALAIRVISAIGGALMLVGTYYFFSLKGLTWLSIFICSIGAFEYAKLVFYQQNEQRFRMCFFIAAVVSLCGMHLLSQHMFAFFTLTFVTFSSVSLWMLRGESDLNKIRSVCFKFALGHLYAVGLPSTLIYILSLETPLPWFALLLIVTFAGDISAYFGGVIFGKNKLMPVLSPKKSVEGAIFGLVGSVAAAAIYCHYLLPEINISLLIAWSVLTAFLCQTGDLFESLLKRTAKVKDSGKIMPGHGGVLDRLDGVYFGAPGLLLLYNIT